MKIDDLEQMESEDLQTLPSAERRKFLKLGLAVTGMYLGGSILSLTSVRNAFGSDVVPEMGKYPYNPHYSMVIREKLCIDCEQCKDACVKTNHVPSYGFRTT
ncbi:MAG TPA: twin-arginine translocation pathway signal protein, partial [Desulfobulbaceae bacterium]|nr:twin-arginine translocation pathway signal protein [Desulfobulbaceae bacterium]